MKKACKTRIAAMKAKVSHTGKPIKYAGMVRLEKMSPLQKRAHLAVNQGLGPCGSPYDGPCGSKRLFSKLIKAHGTKINRK